MGGLEGRRVLSVVGEGIVKGISDIFFALSYLEKVRPYFF